MTNISDRIRTEREKLGLTIRECAEKAKVSQSSWSAWELGVSEPRGTNRTKVAIVLDVDPEWLRTGEGEMLWINRPSGLRKAHAEALPGEDRNPFEDRKILGENFPVHVMSILLIHSSMLAVDQYLRMFHQEVSISRRMELSLLVANRCRELGFEKVDQLSLEDLHAVLSKEVFG